MDQLPLNMYYNTSLRNVGLYTSISLAIIAASRFFLGKGNETRRKVLVWFSVGFLCISLLFNILFIKDYLSYINELKDGGKDVKGQYKWLSVPILVLLMNIVMLFMVNFKNIF